MQPDNKPRAALQQHSAPGLQCCPAAKAALGKVPHVSADVSEKFGSKRVESGQNALRGNCRPLLEGGICKFAVSYLRLRSMSVECAVGSVALQDPDTQRSMSPQHGAGSSRPLRRIRRCASTPTLNTAALVGNGASQTGLDVFVISRPFTEFGGALFARLPPSVKANFVGLGIAHYMTVFRTADGQLHQFDFGPLGGRDIYMSHGAFDKLVQPDQPRAKGKRSVAGEVRENQVGLAYLTVVCAMFVSGHHG